MCTGQQIALYTHLRWHSRPVTPVVTTWCMILGTIELAVACDVLCSLGVVLDEKIKPPRRLPSMG